MSIDSLRAISVIKRCIMKRCIMKRCITKRCIKKVTWWVDGTRGEL